MMKEIIFRPGVCCWIVASMGGDGAGVPCGSRLPPARARIGQCVRVVAFVVCDLKNVLFLFVCVGGHSLAYSG